MFKWYREASVCYAYLHDVDRDRHIEVPGTPSSSGSDTLQSSQHKEFLLQIVTTEIGKARWFTRGWTLQKLIAPSNMKF